MDIERLAAEGDTGKNQTPEDNWEAMKKNWRELSEKSVFPLEAVVNRLGHAIVSEDADHKRTNLDENTPDNVEKIEPEKLKEALLYGGTKEHLIELKSRTIDALGHLYDQVEYARKLEGVEPAYTARFQTLLMQTREKATPAVNALLSDETFLAQLKDDIVSQKFVYHELRFVENSASFLTEENQKRIYSFYRELGNFSDPLQILKCGPEIIELAGKYGENTERGMIEDILFDAFLAKTPYPPNGFNISAMKSEWFQKIAGTKGRGPFGKGILNLLGSAFERVKLWFKNEYGMSLRDITKDQVVKVTQWPDALKTICEIEKENEGGAKILSDKYGIRCFFRYPSDILIRQLNEESEQLPYGVIAFAYSDHNDAFAKDAIQLRNISDTLRTADTTCKVIEAGSGINFMKRLAGLHKEFGKISFLILNAHGQENNFLLSHQSLAQSTVVEKKMLEGTGVKRMKDFFVDNPDVVLLSCSTGAKGGIGEKISETFGARVVAPNQPTGVKKLSVTFDESGKPLFNVTFSKEHTLEEYNAST